MGGGGGAPFKQSPPPPPQHHYAGPHAPAQQYEHVVHDHRLSEAHGPHFLDPEHRGLAIVQQHQRLYRVHNLRPVHRSEIPAGNHMELPWKRGDRCGGSRSEAGLSAHNQGPQNEEQTGEIEGGRKGQGGAMGSGWGSELRAFRGGSFGGGGAGGWVGGSGGGAFQTSLSCQCPPEARTGGFWGRWSVPSAARTWVALRYSLRTMYVTLAKRSEVY